LDAALSNVRDPAHPWGLHWSGSRKLELGSGMGAVASDPGVRTFFNSAFPDGQNDGAVWQGRGLTVAADAGATLTLGPLSLTAHPMVLWGQNRDFALADVRLSGLPSYAYPWQLIDAPQRFGPDPFVTVDPGDSSIRLDVRGVSLGFGTEGLWWGPAIRNAILMSNNAGGFPHAFLATRGPVGVRIGTLEAQWIFGRLGLSDWFDPTFVDRGRYLTGAVVAFTPRGSEGLTLGAARVFYELWPESKLGIDRVTLVFQGVSKDAISEEYGGDDVRDQLFSAFARWALPQSGFEIWAEWARNDHGRNKRDYFLEPEHSQAYTLGFRKVGRRDGGHLVAVQGEVTNLGQSRTYALRATPTYYAHHVVIPGYTQRGQVLGGGLGPGGASQYLGADLYAPWGRAGLFIQRRVHDNDAYYGLAHTFGDPLCCHHVSLDLGGRGTFWIGSVELDGQGTLTKDFNRYFIRLNDLWNANLQVSARWRLGFERARSAGPR
jgi:hypothetical protein